MKKEKSKVSFKKKAKDYINSNKVFSFFVFKLNRKLEKIVGQGRNFSKTKFKVNEKCQKAKSFVVE